MARTRQAAKDIRGLVDERFLCRASTFESTNSSTGVAYLEADASRMFAQKDVRRPFACDVLFAFITQGTRIDAVQEMPRWTPKTGH